MRVTNRALTASTNAVVSTLREKFPCPEEILNRLQATLQFLLILLTGLYKPASLAPINPAWYDLSSTNERAEIIG